jgi:hypothetical protein
MEGQEAEEALHFHEVLQIALDRQAEHSGEGVNVGAIATAAGLSSGRVTAAITGRRLPSHDEVNLLAMAIGLSAEDRKYLQEVRQREVARKKQVAEARGVREATERPSRIRAFQGEARRWGSTTYSPAVPKVGQPDPLLVSTAGELIQALNEVHIWSGSPSLRELEQRDEKLRRSTVSEMLRRESIPKYELFMAFLQGCGVEGRYLDDWVFTWRRLKALKRSGPTR